MSEATREIALRDSQVAYVVEREWRSTTDAFLRALLDLAKSAQANENWPEQKQPNDEGAPDR